MDNKLTKKRRGIARGEGGRYPTALNEKPFMVNSNGVENPSLGY